MLNFTPKKAVTTLVLVFALILMGLAPRSAAATDYTWTGLVSQFWAEPGNWAPAGVPGSNDTATIAKIASVQIGDATLTVQALNISGGAAIVGTNTGSKKGTINIVGSTSVWTSGYFGCTLNNKGTLT